MVKSRSVAVAIAFVLSVLMLTASAFARGRLAETLPLPDGWQPEGIASGPRGTLYAGSIPTGAVYQVNARSGEGRVLVPPREDRRAIGLKWDWRSGLLYVAGGETGKVFVYQARTGSDVAELIATTQDETFVNDAVITRNAVYFTDSLRPVIYRLELLPGGRLPDAPTLEEVPLSGDFEFVAGEFNANGIEAVFGGRSLIVVNSVLGTLYQVNPHTGEATSIDLGDDAVTNGDGLLLLGRTLYVVQNFDNQVARVQLAPALSSGKVVDTLTNEQFDIPTTIARVGFSLYAVNARFSTEPTPETQYSIVRVPWR